jgi:Arc/MetJ-type ribon-helix-helix transcriptional regulator
MPKKTKYPYKLTVNFYDFQGKYLEAIVKTGKFSSINQAIRVAVDRLAGSFPIQTEYKPNSDCPMSSCDDNIFSWTCRANIDHGHCKKFKNQTELDAIKPKGKA